MKNHKKWLAIALALVLSMSLLSGCTSSDLPELPSTGTSAGKFGTETAESTAASESSAESSAQTESSQTAESSQESSEQTESSQGSSQESSSAQPTDLPEMNHRAFRLIFMDEGGEEWDYEALQGMEALGLYSFLIFYSDNTGNVYLFGDSNYINWNETDIYWEGEYIPYDIAEGILTVSNDVFTFRFQELSGQDALDALEIVNGSSSPDPAAGAGEDGGYVQVEIPQNFSQVLIENDDYTISCVGFSQDDWFFRAQIETQNHSGSTINVSIDFVSVEGLMSPAIGYDIVESNGIHTSEMVFDNQWITDYIGAMPTWIGAQIAIYDGSSYELIQRELVDIYPLGEDNALMITFTPDPELNDTLYEDSEIGVYFAKGSEVRNTSAKSEWDEAFSFDMILSNDTDKVLTFVANDVKVNGIDAIGLFWACTLTPGTLADNGMTWYLTEITELGLSAADISELTFTLRAYDANDFWADDVVNVPVTIHFQ